MRRRTVKQKPAGVLFTDATTSIGYGQDVHSVDGAVDYSEIIDSLEIGMDSDQPIDPEDFVYDLSRIKDTGIFPVSLPRDSMRINKLPRHKPKNIFGQQRDGCTRGKCQDCPTLEFGDRRTSTATSETSTAPSIPSPTSPSAAKSSPSSTSGEAPLEIILLGNEVNLHGSRRISSAVVGGFQSAAGTSDQCGDTGLGDMPRGVKIEKGRKPENRWHGENLRHPVPYKSAGSK